jgi:hypothetical protein
VRNNQIHHVQIAYSTTRPVSRPNGATCASGFACQPCVMGLTLLA